MVKKRPVVVVSPRRRVGPGLCLVVPFSTRAPAFAQRFHYEIAARTYPFFRSDCSVWAKADMLTCVAFSRLDRPFYGGCFQEGHLSETHLNEIRNAVLSALGFHSGAAGAIVGQT
jgi:mRNA interferase MazF